MRVNISTILAETGIKTVSAFFNEKVSIKMRTNAEKYDIL